MTGAGCWSPMTPRRTFRVMGDERLGRIRRRCARQVEASFALSNVVGAVFIFAFLTFIAPNEKVDGGSSPVVDISIFVGYFIVVALIGATVGKRIYERATGWLVAEREPTDKERALTLSLVSRLTMMSFG